MTNRIFAWVMDELVVRFLMLTPARRRMRRHMCEVRAQDIRLKGYVHPIHRQRWLKP